MEQLPKPEYDFPWQSTGIYDYLLMKVNNGVYQSMPDNTLMYLYPEYPDLDHIFIFTEPSDDNGVARGIPVWKRQMDESIGEGAFNALCDQMHSRGFEMSPNEEPSPHDIEAYVHVFGEQPERIIRGIEAMVNLAMKDFELKAKYYLSEWD